jgi:hypothetical protein
MTRPDDEDFSPIDLDDDLVRQAILQTQGREYTDEEIEELALEAAEQLEEFKELEARQAQGLWNYPFEGADVFLAVDEYGDAIIPTDLDVIKYLCRNIVRRELSFFEIDKLDKPITRSELAIVVYTKVRAFFPNYEIGREKLKTLLDALTNNPTAEPGMTIPVWNGRTVSKPGNETPLLFDSGLFTVNEWRKPAFRNLSHAEPEIGLFDEFLSFIFKSEEEKDVFLDWLSWCLQNEDDKPSWAIFLYSQHHGTGKSTLASIVKKLFGEQNASEQQGIKPIISRFNKPILLKKLIYAEEVKVAQNSDDGNKLKTLISESQTMAESKGKDIEPVDHRCCFILTTNHKPIWLEPGDRRFYIINVEHEGYAAGGLQYDDFVALVKRIQANYQSDAHIAALYKALLARAQGPYFNAKSLNVNKLATEVMKEISALAPDVVEEMLEEFLREHNVRFVPVRYANKLLEHFARRNPNASKYTFDNLGWKKKKFAWGGKGPAYAYYHPEAQPERGMLNAGNYQQSIESHINERLKIAMDEIGFGITHEQPHRKAKEASDDVPF